MTIEDTIAAVVEAKVRQVVREELRAALAEVGQRRGDDCFLSIARAAELADVHPDTVRGWVRGRQLPEHRAGRELRVKRSELERHLNRGADLNGGRPATPEEEAGAILARRR
jgi:excisionase family DNA binding protein